MKLLLLNIILLFASYKVFSQNDSTLPMIEDAIRSRKGVNKIVYIDSSIHYYHEIRTFVKKRKFTGYKDTTKITLSLSKKEIEFLDHSFKTSKVASWKQNMFENSVLVSGDSIKKIFSDKTKSLPFFHKNFGVKYFLISPPIFFRNNTLVIFRICELYYPVAGYDLLYIYEKRNSSWHQLMFIHTGSW